jgi:hypothetical protein
MRLAAVFVLAGLAAGSLGCDRLGIGPEICDRSKEGNPPQLYTQGDVVDGVYMSSDWDGDLPGQDETSPAQAEQKGGLLFFPGGMRYRIEHKLGQRPRLIQLFLSFDRQGTDTGVLSQAAGNQAEILCVDDKALVVANGSCVEYWLLVVAGVAGAGDGGAPEGDAGLNETECLDENPEP